MLLVTIVRTYSQGLFQQSIFNKFFVNRLTKSQMMSIPTLIMHISKQCSCLRVHEGLSDCHYLWQKCEFLSIILEGVLKITAIDCYLLVCITEQTHKIRYTRISWVCSVTQAIICAILCGNEHHP